MKTPAIPDRPENPEKPEIPVKPEKPVKPVKPEKPEKPVKPVKPKKPVKKQTIMSKKNNKKNEQEQKLQQEQEVEKEVNQEQEEQTEENTEQEQPEESTEQKQSEDAEADLLRQLADYKDKYLRSVAEFDNYRKHTLKEKAELILNGGERTIVALLPIVDDLERAIANNAKSDDIDAIKEGFSLIYQKFMKSLEGMGVKKIETENADFDTEFHNAIAMLEMGEEKKGKVIDCVKAGYTLNEKVIRHADVAVGQ